MGRCECLEPQNHVGVWVEEVVIVRLRHDELAHVGRELAAAVEVPDHVPGSSGDLVKLRTAVADCDELAARRHLDKVVEVRRGMKSKGPVGQSDVVLAGGRDLLDEPGCPFVDVRP